MCETREDKVEVLPYREPSPERRWYYRRDCVWTGGEWVELVGWAPGEGRVLKKWRRGE